MVNTVMTMIMKHRDTANTVMTMIVKHRRMTNLVMTTITQGAVSHKLKWFTRMQYLHNSTTNKYQPHTYTEEKTVSTYACASHAYVCTCVHMPTSSILVMMYSVSLNGPISSKQLP